MQETHSPSQCELLRSAKKSVRRVCLKKQGDWRAHASLRVGGDFIKELLCWNGSCSYTVDNTCRYMWYSTNEEEEGRKSEKKIRFSHQVFRGKYRKIEENIRDNFSPLHFLLDEMLVTSTRDFD